MRKNGIKKAFTLVEIVIVLIVVAILVGLLFQVYTAITQISMRINLQKQVGIKVVHMQTILQNIIDTSKIDYKNLAQQQSDGFVGKTMTLPLINIQGQIGTLHINTSGELIYTTMSGDNQQSVSLLGDEITLKNASFVISVLQDPNNPSKRNDSNIPDLTAFQAIQQPGVWLFGSLVSHTDEKIHFPIQTFYTFIQK